MSRFARQETADGHQRASTLELFYDLVFVFTITQVSHYLLEHLTWTGAGQSLIVLLAVWWSWNYTTWVTNELDAGAVAVRVLVIALMLGSLLMAVAIPEAWGDRALLFACAYVAIQVGRHSFMAFVVGERGSQGRLRALHILIWFCFAGVFWIAGGLTGDDTARAVLWSIAALIDFSAPMVTYRVPGLRTVTTRAWDVISEHFAERFQLFVIIALGESIVLTGATTAGLDLDFETVVAFVVSFLGSAALWWLYFNRAAQLSERALEAAEDKTRLARDTFTYLHVFIVIGIILTAVGDELVIHHPSEHLGTAELIALVSGPAFFLLGLSLVKLRVSGSLSAYRTPAIGAVVLVGLIFSGAPALLISSLLVLTLVVVIALEERRYRRRHGESPA